MHRWMAAAALAAALAAPPGAAQAQAPVPPPVAARHWVVLDLDAGQVLASGDGAASADPAALTKLMTAYLVFVALRDHRLEAGKTLPVSARALAERRSGGALMYLDDKSPATVEQLLQGLVVDSANDAAVVLAEGVAGSVDAFVAMMNRQARAWGLKDTAFRNVTGATEPGHRSSARDLARIAAHVLRDFPGEAKRWSQRDFTYAGIAQENANLLLKRDPSVDGLKAGNSDAAGWCLVASATRTLPGGPRRLVAVVLGADSAQARANEAQKLLNWGYVAWDDLRLVPAGKPVATVPVWKGASATVDLGSPDPIVVAVPHGEGAGLRTRVERTDPLVAPLRQGQRVGTLQVTSATGTAIASVPLTVLAPVPQAGLLGRAWDAIRLWIK